MLCAVIWFCLGSESRRDAKLFFEHSGHSGHQDTYDTLSTHGVSYALWLQKKAKFLPVFEKNSKAARHTRQLQHAMARLGHRSSGHVAVRPRVT